jgi:RNA polymerase sigma factor (sigma-70 family)
MVGILQVGTKIGLFSLPRYTTPRKGNNVTASGVEQVAQARNGEAIREIHRVFNLGTIGNLTDGQLLERFASCDQEAAELAFAALVERHGPMVFRVCRSVLRDRHDAEDAFQATFLILVGKAATIRKESSLGSWLHGVALRVAHGQRAATARRRKHELRAAELHLALAEDEDDNELASILHEELNRLPAIYRAPIVLCTFQSLSHEQAARQLSWPVGTVRSRLARGRERLRNRLVSRGVAQSIVLWNAALDAGSWRAAVPSGLATATARAALYYASGEPVASATISPSVALLVKGVMNVMLLSRMKLVLVACGLIASGAVVAGQQAGRSAARKETRIATASVPENPRSSAPTVGKDDDDSIVAREMGKIDLILLIRKVHDIRDQLEAALREKLRAERTKAPGLRAAQNAFDAASSSYLEKARELQVAQRRRDVAKETDELPAHRAADYSPAVSDREFRGLLDCPHNPSHAAAIGSINMDAIFERCERVQAARHLLKAVRVAHGDELAKMQSSAQFEADILSKLTPGSEDYKKHEVRLTDLKARFEAAREQFERELQHREDETMATIYHEIQDTVASLAKNKGLTYVVKVSPAPRSDAEHNDVSRALNTSVVYADPRNDLTEEVVDELNRRFKARR